LSDYEPQRIEPQRHTDTEKEEKTIPLRNSGNQEGRNIDPFSFPGFLASLEISLLCLSLLCASVSLWFNFL
jgi:hypothetical protein